ncbi:DinB family protein [Mucilaginibacter sp. PAMB04168]|uniref:DinB family protein n=1 Tax=Mucilaginibacter sp. PAMB04168 TaxID=3138567 RepID=UPI0031F6C98B
MKHLLITTFLSLAVYQGLAQQKTTNMLTSPERSKAVQLLQQTEAGVFAAVKGLSEAQLNFKPAADKWSVAECIKHIAAAEKELWAMAEPALSQPANPEKRTEIRFSDDDLVKAVEDRSRRSKTFTALEPANSPYQTVAEALTAFKAGREKLIALVKESKADLRNHIVVLPVGTYDSYQFILLIAAHSNRHTQQIDEVKATLNYPKH